MQLTVLQTIAFKDATINSSLAMQRVAEGKAPKSLSTHWDLTRGAGHQQVDS